MDDLKPGDRVDIRIKQSMVVSPYDSYDEIKTFEIVATDTSGYYLYVPVYFHLKNSVKADSYRCKRLHIDKKFLDENICYIEEGLICRVRSVADGMKCSHCRDFITMAEPNQPNGTLICYACRVSPYR